MDAERERAESVLEIEDLRITPYRYKDETGGDGQLSVVARAKLTRPQHERYLELLTQREVRVSRVGIDDHPRNMWLNAAVWSASGEVFSCEISLVDRLEGGPSGAGVYWAVPWKAADWSHRAIGELLIVLEQKNLLTGEEVDRIRSAASRRSQLIDFFKIDDLDACPFDS